MKAPMLGKIVRLALPLCLAWAPLASAGQTPAGRPPETGLAAIDAESAAG